MSDLRRLRWRSGRLTSTPINDGWAIDRDSRDPSIPNLPLETFVAAVANGIIALCFGYAEAAPAAVVEESYVAQVIEAPAAAQPDIAWYVVTDLAEDEPTEESVTPYFFDEVTPPLLVEFPPADDDEPLADAVISYLIEDAETADLTQIPPPVLTDPEDDYLVEPVADSVVLSIFEDAPAPDLTQIPPPVVAELDEPVWVESYSAHLLHLEAPAPGDLTQIPIPALTDPEDAEELADSLIAYQFEDDALALTVDMPDGDEPAEIEESLVYQVYDEAPPPDLTFIPGWQDDFLRTYEDEREEQEQAALLGMVFDPYGQVDDPPPVVPVSSEMIIRARRRGRR